MPYKSEKEKLGDPFFKKSAKLLPCQKEMIVYWRNMGFSQRRLAAMFHVSRRLIQFILDPERHRQNLLRRDERGGGSQYYDRETHTAAIRKHRRYKNHLLTKHNFTK
jgi:hypothetical protein